MSTSSSDLLRLTYKLAIIVSVVLASTAVTEYFLRKNLSNEDSVNVYKYRDVFRKDQPTDVFVMGNSQSAYGIVPSLLVLPGLTIHNYSFSGACPSFNYELYSNYLRRYQKKPKLIIYAVSWFMFDSSRNWRKLAYDYQFLPTGVDIWKISPYERLYLSHQSDVLNKIFRNNKKNKHDSNILIHHYDSGFVPLDGTYNGELTIKPKITNSAYQLAHFEKFIKMVQRDGGKILFIETPEYLPGIRCESRVPNERLLRSIARANDIAYINYNEERRTDLNFSHRYFGDWTHLNHIGAKRFSRILSSDINALRKEGKIVLD